MLSTPYRYYTCTIGPRLRIERLQDDSAARQTGQTGFRTWELAEETTSPTWTPCGQVYLPNEASWDQAESRLLRGLPVQKDVTAVPA